MSELTADAIRAIQASQKEACEAKQVVKFVPTPDPRVQLQVGMNTVSNFDVPARTRKYSVYGLEDLCAFAEDSTEGLLFYSESGATLVIDQKLRDETVQLKFTHSRAWQRLLAIEETPAAIDQRNLIVLLKNYLNVPATTVNLVRKLDWSALNASHGNIQKGSESLGRTIEQKVIGAADLPDELVVQVPIYDLRGERALYSVTLIIDLDIPQNRFLVTVKPGVLRECYESHLATVFERIKKLAPEIPVYYGSPNLSD